MYKTLISNAKFDLKGKRRKAGARITRSFLSFMFFLLYSFAVIYLLVIDTTLLGRFEIFKNNYFLALVCAAAVTVGFVLLVFSAYERLRKDEFFYSLNSGVRLESATVSLCIKALTVYCLTAIKKIFYTLLFLSPFGIAAAVLIKLANGGVDRVIFVNLCAVCLIFLISGLSASFIFAQRYLPVSFYLIKNPEDDIKEIFKKSILGMNNKCVKAALLKIRRMPQNILSFLIVPLYFSYPVTKDAEAQLAVSKINPRTQTKAYAEKPVVYYFSDKAKTV